MSKPAFRSIEHLKDWFYQMKMPYWTLWNGYSKDAKDRAAYNLTVNDIDQSWDLLERVLERKQSSGGKITVFITGETKSSNGLTEYVDLPTQLNPAISGMGVSSPYIGASGSIAEFIEDRVNTRISIAEKDRRISELEAQLEQKQSGGSFDNLINRLTEKLPIEAIVTGLIDKVIGTNTPAVQQAINGIPETDHNPDKTEQEELSQDQINTINEALSRIQRVFPDVPSFMEKCSRWIEANPSTAKTFFSSL